MNERFVFFGTPALAATILEKLAAANMKPVVIVTTPDKPQGRSLHVTPSPVKVWADTHAIPVLQPEILDETFLKTLTSYTPHIALVVAYGKIIPEKILTAVPGGFFNVHYSLLPRWRGATPVEAAILAGDKETGVSIQKMVYTLDAGAIVAEVRTAIGETETAPALRERLNTMAATLLIKTLPTLSSKTLVLREQNEKEITNCKKIKKENGEIDLRASSKENYLKYRAYFGWPGSYFFTTKNGVKKRILITDAILENDAFKILRVIPEGKREMDFKTWESTNTTQ